jgi:peptidoglycan/LPS O-acetylase OafA/YrhL
MGRRRPIGRVAFGGTPAEELVSGYRPWLDGVRAVAVLLVVAQHTMGQMPIDIGFVGVGIFFALSGYLITSLLLDEHAARGTVSLARFYLRRAARLVPALVTVIVVCDVLFVIAGDRAPLRGSLAALTYTANYAEIWKSNAVPGFGPTWSLAVEEHFYVLWPLALLALTRRSGLRAALNATLAVCAAAFLWRTALALLHVRFNLIAIGSLERADALLYGCAAAIALRLGWRPRGWVVWAGTTVVAVSPIVFAHENYFSLVVGEGVLAVAAAGAVVGLEYNAPAWMRRWLSLRPVVAIGVFSYGIYLWHGPLMRVAADFDHAGRYWRALVGLAAIAVAAVSHHYLEAPIRAWARRRSERFAPRGSPTAVQPLSETQERYVLGSTEA